MTEQAPDTSKEVRISFDVPEGVSSRYATNITIQHTDHEFTISFYEAEPPVILGSSEERAARLDGLTEVSAKCVARIVVAPGRMQAFIDAMQANLNSHLVSKEQIG